MSVHPDAAHGPGVSRILEHVADWERRSRDHLVLVGLIPADAAVATGLITKVAARVRSAVEPELVERAHSAGIAGSSSSNWRQVTAPPAMVTRDRAVSLGRRASPLSTASLSA